MNKAGQPDATRPAAARKAIRPTGLESYSDSMGCMKCLAKHLSKAAVEAAEYAEEPGRDLELALCIGDLACAEDHAKALGLPHEADRIRSIRESVWVDAGAASARILRMASSAVRGSLQRMAAEAADASKDSVMNGPGDSNDQGGTVPATGSGAPGEGSNGKGAPNGL